MHQQKMEIFKNEMRDQFITIYRQFKEIQGTESFFKKIKQYAENKAIIVLGGALGQTIAEPLGEKGKPAAGLGLAVGILVTLYRENKKKIAQDAARKFLKHLENRTEQQIASVILAIAEKLYMRFRNTIDKLDASPQGQEEGIKRLARFFILAIGKQISEGKIIDNPLDRDDIKMYLKAAIPPYNDGLYKSFSLTIKLKREVSIEDEDKVPKKNAKEWSIQGIMYHSPYRVYGRPHLQLKNPNEKAKYPAQIFYSKQEALEQGIQIISNELSETETQSIKNDMQNSEQAIQSKSQFNFWEGFKCGFTFGYYQPKTFLQANFEQDLDEVIVDNQFRK